MRYGDLETILCSMVTVLTIREVFALRKVFPEISDKNLICTLKAYVIALHSDVLENIRFDETETNVLQDRIEAYINRSIYLARNLKSESESR